MNQGGFYPIHSFANERFTVLYENIHMAMKHWNIYPNKRFEVPPYFNYFNFLWHLVQIPESE